MKLNKFEFYDIDFIEKCVLISQIDIRWHIGNSINFILKSDINKIENLQKAIFYLKKSASFIKEDYQILKENKEINIFLTKISKKDFNIFLMIDKVIKYAVNPSIDTLNECLFTINQNIKKEI